MKIRQYNMDDKLVIKSDRANMEMIIIYLFLLVLIDVIFIWLIIDSSNISDTYIIICVSAAISFIFGKLALFEWIGINRTLVMEKAGCMVCFYRYRRFYGWDELAIKRWEDYSYVQGGYKHRNKDFTMGYEISYYEGVFFSVYPVRKPKKMTPNYFLRHRRPLTCFCVNFYPSGITKGHGDYYERRNTDTIFSLELWRAPEVYPIDKEVFVNYMKLWEVDIEGLSMDTENIKYVK